MNMDMIFSKRATQIEEGIFSILNTKKEELLQAGREVYNFSVGTPDFKTPEHIMKAMEEACKDPDNYKYAMADRPEMLEAAAVYCLRVSSLTGKRRERKQ